MLNPIRQLWRAFIYSCQGLDAAWRYQWSFRFDSLIFILAIPLGLYLGQTSIEKILLISSVLLILIVEVINSAIETIVDRISLDNHVLSGRAKDLGSAAVFLSMVNSIMIWSILIIPRSF